MRVGSVFDSQVGGGDSSSVWYLHPPWQYWFQAGSMGGTDLRFGVGGPASRLSDGIGIGIQKQATQFTLQS
jgi:hypothetical protein